MLFPPRLTVVPLSLVELFPPPSMQVPDEFDRVIVGIQSYLSIRKHSQDTSFIVFEADEDKSAKEKRLNFLEAYPILRACDLLLIMAAQLHCHFWCPLLFALHHPSAAIDPSNLSILLVLLFLLAFPCSPLQDTTTFLLLHTGLTGYQTDSRKECASYMASLPVPFRYEYLMAETIFSQIMFLPQPPFKPIYYALVIIDLCKALPGAFPAVVAGAVRSLFNRIGDLDMECRTRLILWFSHHLSNFQYFWPWEEWAHVKDLPRWAPQRVFVQEVLEREVRLSYWDKIKQSIENAPELEELLPPKSVSNFRYNSEEDHGYTLSKEFREMVRGRKTAREITSWVEETIIQIHSSKFAIEVVIQTLLDIGSKSFTHLITVLERYGQVIAKLCTDQNMQVLLIDEVSSYWKNNTQMTAIAIDRMMGYRIISNLAIVSWVFSLSNIEQFHVSDRPWEILRNAINKTYNRIADLRKEIQTLKKSVLLAEDVAVKALKEFEAAETRLEVVDGQPVQAEKPGRLKRLKGYAEKAKDDEIAVREALEAKDALLARALEENKSLFVSLYKSFANVLTERLPPVSADGAFPKLRDEEDIDSMAIDLEEPSTMEMDHDNGRKDDRNSEKVTHRYSIKEQDQWCLCTLGYVKAFSRQYATEIWPHLETLEAVFGRDIHPLFRKAVFAGLCRSTTEM
ncbi:MIF4G like [Musa troglodytarum]|uniref:MIF4G like n=1 Tax=Musa troglodytarum TaxID=320322 RepID=A0A9E7K2Z6_9LILI|nr:MIF4G like [Musa troglodytarum]